jgi:two-component system, OmpR family, sensor histidine kinase MprB
MPLRRRLAWAAAAAVGVAVVLAAVVCYLVVRSQLLGEVTSSLNAQEAVVEHGDIHGLATVPGIPANAGGPAPYVQIVQASGNPLGAGGQIELPITSHTIAVAAGSAPAYMADIRVGSSRLRELTFPVSLDGQPVAIQLARPLDGVERILSHLRLILALLAAAGMALAAALGRLAADRVLSPLAEVAQTAQHITDTEDLSSRLRVHADDEVGQLATRFNAMIERLERSRSALDESVQAQRQLVADASHELRTPVTSLRTNIEVLLAGGELSDEDRHRLLADVVEQSEELSGLVADLIELARGDLPAESVEDTRLDAVVAESLARSRRNAPNIQFESTLEPVIVEGVPDRLGRAVNNLLDNAARHSPPGGTVEVVVDRAGLCVRDHGPGVDEADLPFVFDRFYRGTNSRGQQGSGLGLAIVRQVAQQHGGAVSASNAPDGGAVFRMNLPTQTLADQSPTSELAPGIR